MIPSLPQLVKLMRKLIVHSLNTNPEALIFWRPKSFNATGAVRIMGLIILICMVIAGAEVYEYAVELENEIKTLKETIAQLESKNQPGKPSDSGNGIQLRPETTRQGGGLSFFTCTGENCPPLDNSPSNGDGSGKH